MLSLWESGTLSGYGYRLQSFCWQLPSCGSTYSLWSLPGPSWDGPWHAPTHNCQAQQLCCVLEKNLDWHYPRLWLVNLHRFLCLGVSSYHPTEYFWKDCCADGIPASRLRQPAELARDLNSTSHAPPILLGPSTSKNCQQNRQSPHEKWPWLILFMELPQRGKTVSTWYDPEPSF